MSALSRTRLVRIALAAADALLVDPRAALARVRAPSVAALSVRTSAGATGATAASLRASAPA